MAKSKKYHGINGTKSVLNALKKVMKATGQKYSIRVGIIGNKAYEQHPESGLTNAELGAIHEFGATFEHPGGTPYTINEDGTVTFVSKTKGDGLPKTKPHTIVIPTRSFLRRVLFDKKIQERLYSGTDLTGDKDYDEIIARDASNGKIPEFMNKIANIIGGNAFDEVQKAFIDGGNPVPWPPISETTKKHRKGAADNEPLTDLGDLRDSISVEVKKVK